MAKTRNLPGARVSEEEREMVQRAAEATHQTVSEFVRKYAVRAARLVESRQARRRRDG